MEWHTGSPGFEASGNVVVGRYVQRACPDCIFVMLGVMLGLSPADRALTTAHEAAHHLHPEQDEAFADAWAKGFMGRA
jgi:hypothetical protein